MNEKKGGNRARRVLRYVLIALSAMAVILSAGYIFTRLYDYYASRKAYKTIEEMYVKHPVETGKDDASTEEAPADPAVPDKDEGIPVAGEPRGNAVPDRLKVDWEGLRATNPDIVAWLYVPMADISYPVVQGDTNDEYLHKAFTGEYRYAGSIFLDSENTKTFTDRNTILYGHNMRDGSMFAPLNSLEREAFLEDPWIWVLTPDKDLLYRAFSYHTGETEGSSYTLFSPFARHRDFPDWLDAIARESAFEGVMPGDHYGRVLTLSTCTSRTYTESMILQAVLIRELPEN